VVLFAPPKALAVAALWTSAFSASTSAPSAPRPLSPICRARARGLHACTLPARYLHAACTLPARCLHAACTLPARCLRAACALPARYLHAGANPSKREARGHAATLRALGHTHISAAVLQAALLDFRAAHPPDEERAALEEAWAVVDADADGAVRGGEVHAMLDLILTQGEPLTAEETADFWAEVDTDADGEVTRQGGS
jgi:hypothetical protein